MCLKIFENVDRKCLMQLSKYSVWIQEQLPKMFQTGLEKKVLFFLLIDFTQLFNLILRMNFYICLKVCFDIHNSEILYQLQSFVYKKARHIQ